MSVQSTLTYGLRPLSGFSHHHSKAPIFDPGRTKSHHFSILSSHLNLTAILQTHPQPPSEPPVSYPMRYLAFRRHLGELHVTLAHLEKKQTRIQTYTNISQEFLLRSWRWLHR
ncbi:hypothetical protein Tco_0407013 [Tanacetum coccineum]